MSILIMIAGDVFPNSFAAATTASKGTLSVSNLISLEFRLTLADGGDNVGCSLSSNMTSLPILRGKIRESVRLNLRSVAKTRSATVCHACGSNARTQKE